MHRSHVLSPAVKTLPSSPAVRSPTDVRTFRITGATKWTLIGLYGVMVVFCMLLFLQSDVLYSAFISNQVALGHLDVYRHFSAVPSLRPLDTVMPPPFYLLSGLYLKLLLLLHIDPVTTDPRHIFMTVFGVRSGPSFMAGLFLLKIPNLVALLVGYVFMRKLAFLVRADQTVVAILWLASPVIVVTSLMHAMNDGAAAAATAAALWAFGRRSPVAGMILIGLAACLKSYALILVPVTALLLSARNPLMIVKLGVAGVALPVLTSLPFLSHEFIQRVFHAHDSGTLTAADTFGRMPTHLWPLAYLGFLVIAFVVADRRVDVLDIAALWLMTLGSIFVLSWWVPQWTAWLLPMAVILAAKDRGMLWSWLAFNATLLANNLVNFPGNMDGGMLAPIFGQGPGQLRGHVYAYHLYLFSTHLSFALRDAMYLACAVTSIVLVARAGQWLLARASVERSARPEWLASRAGIYATLLIPLILVPYVAVMFGQRIFWTA
jgi:hypothetical protein